MKKILSLCIIVFLLISGFGVVAFDNRDAIIKVKEIMYISQPTIKYRDEYVSIGFEESESFIYEPGKPLLPVVTKIFTFPLRTKIIDVIVNCEWEDFILSKKIQNQHSQKLPLFFAMISPIPRLRLKGIPTAIRLNIPAGNLIGNFQQHVRLPFCTTLLMKQKSNRKDFQP